MLKVTDNKIHGNSTESKTHGYPPFLDGIGIEIPSPSTPPYWNNTKFFSVERCTESSLPEFIYRSGVPEIFHVESSIEMSVAENFPVAGIGGNFPSAGSRQKLGEQNG